MNNQEIERLAREYAEEIYESSDLPFKDDIICDETDNAMSVLRFILRDHCIVPKEKVMKEHEAYTFLSKAHPKASERHIAKSIAESIAVLFGADLFKERSEE